MTHRYIDEYSIAERYLEHALPPPEHDAFESHLVGCDECTDRLLLAQIFLDHKAIGTAKPAAAKEPGAHGDAAQSAAVESISEPRPPEATAESAVSATAEREPQASASGVPVSSERPPADWPKRAQFVAQFTPWQLFFLAVAAALWLLLVPTAYFLGQLTRLIGTH